MTETPLCIEADDSVKKAQSLMRETGYRALPVCEGEKIVGVLSRGDALAVTSRKTNIDVRGIMSHNVVAAAPEEDLFNAAHKITESGVKQLPVIDGENRIVGILSSMDILKTFVENEYKTVKKKVNEVMSTDVVSCVEDEEISKIWGVMEESGFGGLPVVDKKYRVTGIVTRMDMLKKRSLQIGRESGKSKKTPIKKAMKPKPYTVKAESDTEKAAELMVKKKIIRLPVIDENQKLVGIIDSEDVLRSYLS